jgi:hypothetical protein
MTRARRLTLELLKRSQRATLDGALLTGNGSRYALSRVGVVGLRALLRTAAEIWILLQAFPYEFLLPLFALRPLPSLVTGVQWGALETLRGELRRAIAGNLRPQARALTESWLTVSALSGMGVVCAVVWLLSRAGPHGGADSLYGSFALLCACVLAVELWTRTYHAGVYALGRVYRPVWTMFVPDLFELGVLVLSYRRLGPFALHAMVLLGTIVRTAITLVYARHAYRARNLALPAPLRLRALLRIRAHEVKDSIKHAAATLPLQFDRMLLIALLHAPTLVPGALPLAMPYYALRPIAGFAQGWVRTFYADFVRLDIAAVSVLRARFERLLARVSLVTGAISALTLVLGAYVLFGSVGAGAALWLAPLSLMRSRFALEQLRAFSYGDLPALLRTGAIMLAGLLLASWAQLSDRVMLALVLFVLGVVQIMFGRVKSRAPERRLERSRRLSLASWIFHLSAHPGPVRIAVALVDDRVARAGALLTVLAKTLDTGRVARLGRSWVLWWEPLEQVQGPEALATLVAGSTAKVTLISAATGKLALAEAHQSSALPHDLARALASPPDRHAHARLREQALALIPHVHTLDMHGQSPELAQLAPRDLATLRRVLIAEAREQGVVPSFSPWQVAVYAPRGEAELVFVWPAHTAQGGALQREARRASWRDSAL